MNASNFMLFVDSVIHVMYIIAIAYVPITAITFTSLLLHHFRYMFLPRVYTVDDRSDSIHDFSEVVDPCTWHQATSLNTFLIILSIQK